MTQLPINPLIRSKLDKAPLIEATEHEIKMKVWFEKPRNPDCVKTWQSRPVF